MKQILNQKQIKHFNHNDNLEEIMVNNNIMKQMKIIMDQSNYRHQCPSNMNLCSKRILKSTNRSIISIDKYLNNNSLLLILFGWYLTICHWPVQAKPNNNNNINNNNVEDIIPWFKYRCNLTMFPNNDGCNSIESSCDHESQLCICNDDIKIDDHYFDIDDNDEQQEFTNANNKSIQNHLLLSTRKLSCLPRRNLGEHCQHSAQCYSRTMGANCLNTSPNRNKLRWQCSCVFGFKDNNPNECIIDYQATNEDEKNLAEQCEQAPGYLWISMLKRCLFNNVQYSMRVGRAGGGRSGQGGSVGRNTGSRSWFTTTRNNAAMTINLKSTLLIKQFLMMMMIIILWSRH